MGVDVNLRRMVTSNVKGAGEVVLIILNRQKYAHCLDELKLRLRKLHLERYLTVGNRISVFFFGVQLMFEIKLIIPFGHEGNVKSEKSDDVTVGNVFEFYKITDKTKWNLCRLVKFFYFIFCFNRLNNCNYFFWKYCSKCIHLNQRPY